MKINNFFKILFIFLLVFLFVSPLATQAAGLADRLAGRILLQVQQNGEAWYVDPLSKERFYLGRPADAFQVMRELGLGISEADYIKLKDNAPNRLLGRIMLRVHANGEAYYVNPLTRKFQYMGRPSDAFGLMRENGLGITDANLSQITVDFRSALLPGLSLMTRFPNKLVYTTDTTLSSTVYSNDCRSRNGLFKTCGTICDKDAEACATVCAYTCEKILLSKNISTWKSYSNSTIGFSLRYPAELEIKTPASGEISFVFVGPTQTTGTELFDGISLSVAKDRRGLFESLKELAEDDLSKSKQVGTITKALSTTTVNGVSAYTYQYDSVGLLTKIFLPKGGRDVVVISYLSPDPVNFGYAEVVNNILTSFKIN